MHSRPTAFGKGQQNLHRGHKQDHHYILGPVLTKALWTDKHVSDIAICLHHQRNTEDELEDCSAPDKDGGSTRPPEQEGQSAEGPPISAACSW